MLDYIVIVHGSKPIKYIRPVLPEQADGLAAEIYAQARREFLVAPPFVIHSPEPILLALVWAMFREALVSGSVPRAHKEAVAAGVSAINACPYCVDAHTMSLHGAKAHGAAGAISNGCIDDIDDPRLKKLVAWAQASRTPNADLVRWPPFTVEDAPELIGVAVTFHYVNRMVHVFLNDSPLPGRIGPLRGLMKRIAGGMLKGMDYPPPPGDSLRFLPDADLPKDMSWASGNATITSAFAGAAAAADAAGRTALTEAVRTLVQECLQTWQGEHMGMNRQWIEDAVSSLNDADKSAGRLALLTALASYQVDESVVRAFQREHPEDVTLVGATAWASFSAARRIGHWLGKPLRKTEAAI